MTDKEYLICKKLKDRLIELYQHCRNGHGTDYSSSFNQVYSTSRNDAFQDIADILYDLLQEFGGADGPFSSLIPNDKEEKDALDFNYAVDGSRIMSKEEFMKGLEKVAGQRLVPDKILDTPGMLSFYLGQTTEEIVRSYVVQRDKAMARIKELLELKQYWEDEVRKMVAANLKLGAWMSAALEDPGVCKEMKQDIEEWFESWEMPKEKE